VAVTEEERLVAFVAVATVAQRVFIKGCVAIEREVLL